MADSAGKPLLWKKDNSVHPYSHIGTSYTTLRSVFPPGAEDAEDTEDTASECD